MSVDIVLIFGDSNSGKSSLVRCLTGKGNDWNKHPSPANVKRIEWRSQNQYQQEYTLVLNSSLNEGPLEPLTARGTSGGTYNFPNTHPLDVFPLIGLYQSSPHPITRAILCVSDGIRTPEWTSADYIRNLSAHQSISVTHSIQIGHKTAGPTLGSQLTVPSKPTAINQVAAQVRGYVGLK